jgi:uncharacterized membrane protein (UPF0127 family)
VTLDGPSLSGKVVPLKRMLLGAAVLGLLFEPDAFASEPPQTNLPRVQLSVGLHLIRAQVANSMESRAKGLMFTRAMPANEGMLFVFDSPAQQCMWMKNTLIPLSVAFIDAAGQISNIAEMQPQTEQTHCSTRPAKYALEMNAGWFAGKGIRPEQRLIGVEQAPPAR